MTDRQTDIQTYRQTGHRNTNLELFRIISMLFIVAHHYVVNSGMMTHMVKDLLAPNSLFFFIFGAWGKTGINCFVLITGYFMCKSHITLRKFLKLIFQIEFYNIVIFCIFVLTGYQSFSLGEFIKAIIPVRVISDGFTSAFIVFFLTIPFLNILLNHLSEKMHLRLIILCLFLYTFLGTMPGFGVTMNYVSWFIVIYFISSYVRLYPKQVFEKTSIWGIASLTSIAISAFSIFVCLYTGWFEHYYFISDSNKILAVVSAFCLFMFFKNVKIPYVRFINTVASASFGVLLIHANSDTMRQWLWRDTLHNAEVFNTSWCYLHFIVSVLGIYVICTCIDLIRIYCLEKFFFMFYDKKFPRVYNWFYSKEKKLLKKFHIQS